MKMDMTGIDHYPNTSGWEVKHDANDNLYYVENAKGQKLPGKYTTRVLAHAELVGYLETLKATAGPGRGKKKVDGNEEVSATS